MTDNNNKTTLKEAFDAELMKRLEENPPEIPTYEEFSTMVDKSLAERYRRRKRIAGIAAGFVVVLLAGILACTNLTTDVDADKNPKEEIITEDGVIIEDGGWGSSEDEDNVRIITDWEHVEKGRNIVPDLFIPGYIPEGYEFESLTIENFVEENFTCEYKFINSNHLYLEIEIVNIKGGEVSTDINDVTTVINTNKGVLYIQGKTGNKRATMQIDDGLSIYIWGDIVDQELVRIVNNLKN